jgi:SAM-dependent methyltransferase
MALDPSKIKPCARRIYPAGEIVFPVAIMSRVKVSVTNTGACEIAPESRRHSLIMHAYELMRSALQFQNGLFISVENRQEIRHAGLGSSGCLIAGVAAAINELYGNPIPRETLVQYLAQNHGEEIDGDDQRIMPVQCIGGSAAAGIVGGGLLVIAGASKVIRSMPLDNRYAAVIGVPNNYLPPDSETALCKEAEQMQAFIDCGRKYAARIAYRVLHECLPAMTDCDLARVGDLIYDYRYKMGSIKNCSFLYPGIVDILNELSFLKKDGIAEVLSLSSVGPGVFAITARKEECVRAFEQQDLRVWTAPIANEGYVLVSRRAFGARFWNDPAQGVLFAARPLNPFIKKALAKAIKPRARAIDIGSGGGRHSAALADLGYDTYAIDLNPAMVERTRDALRGRYPAAEIGTRVRVGTMSELDFSDAAFDLAVATGVFHQANTKEEYARALRETARVLKPRGILVTDAFIAGENDGSVQDLGEGLSVTCQGMTMTLLSRDEFMQLAHDAGFIIVEELPAETKMIETGVRTILRAVFVRQ